MKPRDVKIVKVLGKVGWVAKALVYSIIGGEACQSGVGHDVGSISPQVQPTCNAPRSLVWSVLAEGYAPSSAGRHASLASCMKWGACPPRCSLHAMRQCIAA